MESNCRVRRQSIARRTNGRSGGAARQRQAPATPNAVKAFVRPLRFEFLRFEFRLPCDMVEASHFTPALICNYTTMTAPTLDHGGGKWRAVTEERLGRDCFRPMPRQNVRESREPWPSQKSTNGNKADFS